MRNINQEVLLTYKGLMSEIRNRNDALNRILENQSGLGPIVVRECGYLQIRIMCELVALACVVAHDELTQVQLKKLRKTYHAADILDGLERHHANFFPRPMTRKATLVQGERGHQLTFVEGGLDKAGLKRLWERCGRFLHRGSVNQLSVSQPIEKDFKDVRSDQLALVGLLNQHVIAIQMNQRWLVCEMMSAGSDGGPTVAIAEGVEPPTTM